MTEGDFQKVAISATSELLLISAQASSRVSYCILSEVLYAIHGHSSQWGTQPAH
jgi:hypothetical protein